MPERLGQAAGRANRWAAVRPGRLAADPMDRPRPAHPDRPTARQAGRPGRARQLAHLGPLQQPAHPAVAHLPDRAASPTARTGRAGIRRPVNPAASAPACRPPGHPGSRRHRPSARPRPAGSAMSAQVRRRASWPVGRVLRTRSRGPAAIHLGLPLLAASCDLPASSGGPPSNARAGNVPAKARPPLDLAPGGVYRAAAVTCGAGGLLQPSSCDLRRCTLTRHFAAYCPRTTRAAPPSVRSGIWPQYDSHATPQWPQMELP